MAEGSKERDFSLLQKNPDRDVLFEKMREALLLGMLPGEKNAIRKRGAQPRGHGSWWIRMAVGSALLAGAMILIAHKDHLLSRFGYECVPSLPAPREALGTDEQALYWTYALYDIGKLRKRYMIQGYYAIDAARARKGLNELMPKVSPTVLGEISAYTPIAFSTLNQEARK